MLFRLVKALVYLYMSVLFRIELVGAENIPGEGAVIICSNHVQAHDPLLLATRIKRRTYYLGKKELFTNALLRPLFLWLGAYPVDREKADMRAYKWAFSMLKRGDALVLFSQGTRYAAKEDAAKSGVALFALKARAAVVPCGITRYGLFSRVRLSFGEPVSFDEHYGKKPDRELLESLTAELMTKVFDLAEMR